MYSITNIITISYTHKHDFEKNESTWGKKKKYDNRTFFYAFSNLTSPFTNFALRPISVNSSV